MLMGCPEKTKVFDFKERRAADGRMKSEWPLAKNGGKYSYQAWLIRIIGLYYALLALSCPRHLPKQRARKTERSARPDIRLEPFATQQYVFSSSDVKVGGSIWRPLFLQHIRYLYKYILIELKVGSEYIFLCSFTFFRDT